MRRNQWKRICLVLLAAVFCLLTVPGMRAQAASTATPAAPEIYYVSGNYGKITVAWKKVADAESYVIYRREAPEAKTAYVKIGEVKAADTNVYTYDDTTMKSGHTYYYGVTAMVKNVVTNQVTETAMSAEDGAKTSSAALVPVVELGELKANHLEVTITWKKPEDAAISKYRILRSRDDQFVDGKPVFDDKGIATIDATESSYTDKTAEPGHKYTYTVQALVIYQREDGQYFYRRGHYNETGLTTDVLKEPVKEVSLEKVTSASGRVALAWTPVDVDGYQIYRRTFGSEKWNTLTTLSGGKRNYYWDSSAVPGTAYTYAIAGYVQSGSVKTIGDKKAMTSQVTCAPATPIITKLKTKSGKDTLTWKKVSKCTGYVVYMKNSTTGGKWKAVKELGAGTGTITLAKDGSKATSYAVRSFVTVGSNRVYCPVYDTISNEKKTLSKKKVLFLGDSITAGKTWKGKKASVPFPERVAQVTGVKYTNAGVGSSTVAKRNASDSSSMVARSKSKVKLKGYALIWIAGGTNDYAKNIKIGKIGDSSDRTFYGAWNNIFKQIRAKNPKAKVVLMSPLYRMRVSAKDGKEGFKVKNKAGNTLQDYAKAMKKIAKKYKATYWDGSKKVKINSSNAYSLLYDGLHLTDEGYLVLGDSAASCVKKVLKK